MTEQDVKELEKATENLKNLEEEYEEKIAPFVAVRNRYYREITKWFNGFIETDSKMKELLRNVYADTHIDIGDNIKLKVGEWDYDNVYIQHFRCEIPVKDMADVINGSKSLWDYNPDIKNEYFC